MHRLILLTIALGILFPARAQRQALASPQDISLEEIWTDNAYTPKRVSSFRWMLDDTYYSVLVPGQGIARYNITDRQQTDWVVDFSSLPDPDLGPLIEAYSFSADEQYVLLHTQVESIYRHSTREVVYAYDRRNGNLSTLHAGKPTSNALFSPAADKVAYVFGNNVYIQQLEGGEITQVTADGKQNQIINGHTDWVYEEEFAFTQGMDWSKDGKRLAFYRFDESEVKEYFMPKYGELYPVSYVFKYPKAGEDNAIVTLHIFDLQTNKTVQADLGTETDQYIPRMQWTHIPEELAVMRLNRLQNKLDLLLVNARTGKTQKWFTESSETYIREVTDNSWTFLSSGDLIWLSERSGYLQPWYYDRMKTGPFPLVEGDFEIVKVVGVDEAKKRLYYLSKEDSPLESQLYSVNFKGKKKRRMTPENGTHAVEASSAFNYFVDTYSAAGEVPQTRLLNQKGEVLEVLESNSELKVLAGLKRMQAQEFFTVKNDGGETLNGYFIKPADFDSTKAYPLLMYVYGGPGDQKVNQEWAAGRPAYNAWFQMLAQKGILVACVDGRGTGGRGRDFRAQTYQELGKYETEDQLSAARYLGSLAYVDAQRIGIFGWSYGAYISSLCMTKGNGLFKAGIAVAPVTNWRFYDTIYTERYMRRPQENASGYDQNSPINFAADLKGEFLLMHGSADDNVHLQNTIDMADALIEADKDFDLFIYPNKAHSMSGGNARKHIFRKMTYFLIRNL